jgi:mycothiol synthase
MDTLLMRSYQGETDLEAIAKLYENCEQVDQLGYWTTVEDLRQFYSSPQFDPALDLRLWENNQGQLMAVGSLSRSKPGDPAEGFLGFRVHPQFRGKILERDMIAWGTQRLQEAYRDQPGEIKLRSSCRTDQPDRVKRLEEWGFVADRYFFEMQRDLHQPIPQPQLPAGFVVRTVNVEEAKAWVEMFNQTFIDHWNHHDLTLEQYQHYLKSSDYCSHLDLVATAADGRLAGFCESQIHPYDNQRNGRNEGWINVLGTRRGFRQLGLGRGLLLTGMQRLKNEGMDIAMLGVDSQNPSGALRLYESVGFQKRHTSISYVRGARKRISC